MYPDLITPRSHPHLLARADYDPMQVMPDAFPAGPRVFTTAAQLHRARKRVADGNAIDVQCLDQLIRACELDKPLPEPTTSNGSPNWRAAIGPLATAAFDNALAWALADDARHRSRALDALRRAADAASRVVSWTGHEHGESMHAARAYDLLCMAPLEADDDNRFRQLLWTLIDALDQGEHRGCNNHNSMNMNGRISIAAALGHRGFLHDVLYGCARGGAWRYGLIHLLRHDFLSDGMQWEGAMGYHMLVLRMVSECLTVMEHLGVDLWQRDWPSLNQDDGYDEHRGWGPRGGRCIKAAFEALIYQTFTNGDYSMTHDQILGNLRGAYVWWPLFNKAYDVYGDDRFAWVLRQINGGKAAKDDGTLPVWLADGRGASLFVRIERRDHPEGANPLTDDRDFSLTGRHVHGCSLFPVHGSAVLRSETTDGESLGASLYFGPHWAGHRSPAALHLDIHGRGRLVTNAPHLTKGGYDDPMHLTWVRSTIAHNTVTVDEQPMFPFDFPTDSLWECDHWRDTLSDSELILFQPERDHKAVRVRNDNVYKDVRLDRTLVLTGGYVLDVFRVTTERTRQFDWAMHCHGTFALAGAGEPIDLGTNRGYMHMTSARRHQPAGDWTTVDFTLDKTPTRASLHLGGLADAQLITAADPPPDERTPIGDRRRPEPRTCLLVRTRSDKALFVSVWSLGESTALGHTVTGTADGDVTVEVACDGKHDAWSLTMAGAVTRG